jgi:tetratricopeptide (TPR) repeat protein
MLDSSFPKPLLVQCADCGRQHIFDLWLIVDGVRRPDLLARVADGTIHGAVCPACREMGYLAGPLLLYLGPAEPPLFAPDTGASADLDAAQRKGLVARLARTLGAEWPGAEIQPRTIAWDVLATEVAGKLQRSPLATKPPADLADPARAEDVVAYLHDRGVKLSADYLKTRHPQTLDAAILMLEEATNRTAPGARELPRRLVDLGSALRDRYTVAGGASTDLERAIPLMRRALEMPGEGGLERLVYSYLLALAMVDSYLLSAARGELDEAIDRLRAAVAGFPAEAAQRLDARLELGRWLYERFLLERREAVNPRLDDLVEAAEVLESALDTMHSSDPRFLEALERLADVVSDRASATETTDDLDRAVAVHRRLVSEGTDSPRLSRFRGLLGIRLLARHADQPALLDEAVTELTVAAEDADDRWLFLDQLGLALRARYMLRGHPADLEQAIERGREATRAAPTDQERGQAQLNLGTLVQDRFHATGQVADLEEAVRAFEAAAEAPTTARRRVVRLSNLALALSAEQALTFEAQALERAVQVAREAAELAAPQDIGRCFTNLATVLLARHRVQPQRENLDEALSVMRRALPEPAGRPPTQLTTLGIVLRQLHAIDGQAALLDEAITLFRDVAARHAEGSPRAPAAFLNLGTCLLDRAQSAAPRPEDLAEATTALRLACQHGVEIDLESALAAASTWSGAAGARGAWAEVVEATGYSFTALDRLYRTQLTRHGKEAWLRRAQGLAGRAAHALARTGQVQAAAIALERGKARGLSETLARERADLGRLRKRRPSLAARYVAATDHLRAAEQAVAREDIDEARAATARAAVRRAREAFDRVVADVRRVPGYETFLAEITWADVSSTVGRDEALVFLTTTEQGTLALTLHRDATGSVHVEPAWFEQLTDVDLRQLLAGGPTADHAGGWFRAYRVLAEETLEWANTIDRVTGAIGRAVVAPLVRRLQGLGVDRAIVIPTGFWSFLPLHAAWAIEGGQRVYTLDRLVLSYAPSARALTVSRGIAGAAVDRRLLAVDEPRPVTRGGPLTHSRAEVDGVAGFFPTAQRTILRGERATSRHVQRKLRSCRVAHFSCHGAMDWDDPERGGLLLAHDEMLTVRDIFDLHLDGARLAVLSACETGIVGTTLPDEGVALPSALIRAGFGGIVSTLWPVAQVSTAMLMKRFYQGWMADGLDPATALREAQRWLRDSSGPELPGRGRYAHPFWWAAFYLTGV